MKRIYGPAILILMALLALSGCDTNIFADFDVYEAPSAADLEAQANSNPTSFVDDVTFLLDEEVELKPEQVTTIKTKLVEIYNDTGNDQEVIQEAAAAAGELFVTSDPQTKEVVDNVVTAVLDLIPSDNSDVKISADVIVQSVFGSEPVTVETVSSIFKNLSDSAAAFEAMLNNAGTDADGVPVLSEDINAGEVAQTAILAVVATELYTAVEGVVGVNVDSVVADLINGNTIDPTVEQAISDVSSNFLDTATDTNVEKLLMISGLASVLQLDLTNTGI